MTIVAANLDPIESAKRLASHMAVDRHVKPHHKVIGIGSGSTVPYVVERILSQGEQANQSRVFIPTGFQSKQLIVDAGLHLADLDVFPEIDVTIDGADEIDKYLNCIKGGGACHLREKALAEAAKSFILVADYRKHLTSLSSLPSPNESTPTAAEGAPRHKPFPIPIEIVPFTLGPVMKRLPTAKLRMSPPGGKAGPVLTDNGNFVLDALFPAERMKPENLKALYEEIKLLNGVVEVGLFVGMADAAYFGNADGSVSILSKNGSEEKFLPPVPKIDDLESSPVKIL